MPGLLDIAPPEIAVERVNIRGTELEVRGIRNREWATLLRRFPVLQKQAAGLAIADEEMAVASIEMMPVVIAAGIIKPPDGDQKLFRLSPADLEAEIANRLSDAEQAEVFGVIMRLTNPPGPLAESPVAAGQPGNGKATTTHAPSTS